MSELVATIVFGSIMSIGAVTWLIAVHYANRLSASRLGSAPSIVASKLEEQMGLNTGELVCEASREELMDHIPKVLRRQSLSILSSVFKLEEKSENELTFHRIGPLMCNLPMALYFTRVRFRLEPQSSKTTLVKYSIDQAEVLNLMKRISMRVLLLIAFPIMVAIGLLMCCFVIPSQSLAIRFQTIQTIHIFHAIWPAFMFIGIAAAARTATKRFVERALMIASDPELLCFADELLPRGRPPIRTSSSGY